MNQLHLDRSRLMIRRGHGGNGKLSILTITITITTADSRLQTPDSSVSTLETACCTPHGGVIVVCWPSVISFDALHEMILIQKKQKRMA